FNSLQSGLIIALLFVVLRLVTRRTWSAVVLGMLITTFASGSGSALLGGVAWLELAGQALAIALLTIGIFRYGLLVTVVTLIVDNIPGAVPIVSHGPAWAAVPGHLSLAIPIALAAFGFYAARAGQPLFGRFDS